MSRDTNVSVLPPKSQETPRIAPTFPSASRLVYRADIDGLRAIAVLSVVGFHAFPKSIRGGFIGVDVFFVISGFLVSSIILSNLANASFTITGFYLRRIRRIFPALITVMLVCAAFGWFALLGDEYKQLGKHLAGGAGFISNFILWGESGYFDNVAETKPLLHLWSLAIEEQFYIFWPLLLAFAWRRRWNSVVIPATVALISFIASVYLVATDQTAAFYSPISRFWELMIGSVLAAAGPLGRGRGPAGRFLHSRFLHSKSLKSQDLQSALGLLLLAFSLFALDRQKSFPGWWAAAPTLGAFFIIAAGPDAYFNKNLLSSRVLVWFGLISYPLYLWHWPLLSFARIIESTAPPRAMAYAAVLLSILLAWLTYGLIEKPIRLAHNGRRGAVPLLLTAMGAAGVAGALIYARDGVVSRAAVANYSLNGEVTGQFVGPLWRYMTNDVCLKRFPFKESESYGWWFCMLKKPESPTVLLLGNSYANQLYPGFAANARLGRHNVLSIGACDPAKDGGRETGGGPCAGQRPQHQKQFIESIVEQTPSLKFAILDGLNPAPSPAYSELLRQRVEFLAGHGVRVVIFIPHLKVDYDIRGCFSRPFKQASANCELAVENRQTRLNAFKPVIDAVSQVKPEVLFFDQNSLFCDSRRCSMTLNGMPLFRDEAHHISEFGSTELAKLFASWAETHLPEILQTK